MNAKDNGSKKEIKDTPRNNKKIDSKIDTYQELPERLDKTYFVKLNVNAYDDSNPIPVDRPMPNGIVYTVQVGAFRNPIPNNTFRQFSPVRGERLNNGLTRYTVGFFNEKVEANKARDVIRAAGFPDAFVVIYKDGKKVADPFTLANKNKLPPNKKQQPDAEIKNNQDNSNGAVSRITPDDEGFYTIQIGVFGRPANENELKVEDVLLHYSESTNLYKYSAGKYVTKAEALANLSDVRAKGYPDAFITAYYKGQKISIAKADGMKFKKTNKTQVIIEKEKNEETKEEKVVKEEIMEEKKDSTEREKEIYEFKLSEIYGIYKCCQEDQGICNNPDNKDVVKSMTLISNGSGVAITGKNETINFQWKFVRDSDTPIQGMEKILGDNYSFYYKDGIIHLGNYCKPKDK